MVISNETSSIDDGIMVLNIYNFFVVYIYIYITIFYYIIKLKLRFT
jgi:hypothetical protein